MTSNQSFPEEYTDGYVIFMWRRFIVDPRALIPRLETEILVKYCLKLLRENPSIQTVADIGTGSGIIPISIAEKIEQPLDVFATDMSQEALDLARENASKTPFLKGDVTEWQGDLLKKQNHSWNFTEIPYKSELTEKAKELRKNMTWPEKKIWYSVLQQDTFKWLRFLRQKPLLDYIVDFYCHELWLVIELDGFSHHGNEEYDQKRTKDLEQFWLTLVRFSNDEVLFSFDDVCRKLEKIIELLQNKSSVPRQARDTSFKKEVSGITFLHWDLLQPLISHFWNSTPDEILITANLPYVREKEIWGELLHEPRMAFFGGVQTGFELYERFFDQLFAWENRPKKCHVVIEFWLWQRDIAETVLMSKNCSYTFFADLRGIERFAHICLSR